MFPSRKNDIVKMSFGFVSLSRCLVFNYSTIVAQCFNLFGYYMWNLQLLSSCKQSDSLQCYKIYQGSAIIVALLCAHTHSTIQQHYSTTIQQIVINVEIK